jgi:DNA-binding transcriptional regulator YhcF (GntR family)
MAWELDSDRPIYSQIYDRIKTRIICGIYKPGERLPSVRELAIEASVNPNTMQRAFTELEKSGLIVTLRNSGRVVTEDKNMIDTARNELALSQIKSFFEKMKELGYTSEEILELIKNVINS